jgi:hypothetical protein
VAETLREISLTRRHVRILNVALNNALDEIRVMRSSNKVLTIGDPQLGRIVVGEDDITDVLAKEEREFREMLKVLREGA